MINTSFSRKKLILVILSALFLFFLAGGIYFLFVNNNTKVTTYTFNKYSDVSNWCDITNNGNELKVDCKALLLNISNNDNNSCFDTQVITNDKELENLTVCENGDTLTYTNEVLGYKVLMPIDMVFTYTRESILNDYRFKNVSITKLDDSYVESIVNEDISNLVTIDPSSTTIKNSVDFCPRPEILPEYVTQENKDKYTEFFNNNIMPKEEYTNGYIYNLDDSVIRTLFASESAKNLKYNDLLNLHTNISTTLNLNSNLPNPNFESSMDNSTYMYIKRLSLFYDNSNFINAFITQDNSDIQSLLNEINTNVSVPEVLFCSLYNVYKLLNETTYSNYIQKSILNNLAKSKSIVCGEVISSEADHNGIYLKYKDNAKSNFELLDRCLNLNKYLAL